MLMVAVSCKRGADAPCGEMQQSRAEAVIGNAAAGVRRIDHLLPFRDRKTCQLTQGTRPHFSGMGPTAQST